MKSHQRRIAILGASYLQLPLVEKAKQMGIETHCFAWDNEYAVCRDACDFFYPISVLDKETILAKCREKKVHGITTIATDLVVPTICYVAKNLDLVSNSIRSSEITTNKFKMREALGEGNILIPSYFELSANEVKNMDQHNLDFPLIVKPIDRSGSIGVMKVDNTEELHEAIKIATSVSFQKKCIIEEYIEGDEVSVESISWGGEHRLLAITDKYVTGPPHFVELGHHQPSMLSEAILNKIRNLVPHILTVLQIECGAGHTELKIDCKGNIYVIEVGARMGGDFIGSHLVEISTGYDFLEAVINVSLGEYTPPCSITHKQHAGVYFLTKQTEHLLPFFQTTNCFDVQKELFDLDLKDITSSNERSGYLIYQGNERINLI